METFHLDGAPYIRLCDLLKTMGLCETGGHAKAEIAEGTVMVNGEIELRKRYKVTAGSEILYGGVKLLVVD